MNNGLSDLSLPYVSACLCRLTLLEELFVSLAQSQGLTGKWLPSLKGLTALRKLSFLVGGVRLTDEDLQVLLQGLPEAGIGGLNAMVTGFGGLLLGLLGLCQAPWPSETPSRA